VEADDLIHSTWGDPNGYRNIEDFAEENDLSGAEPPRAAALRRRREESAAELPEPHWQPILGLIGLGLNGSVLKQNYVRIVAACVFCLSGIR
jgi:hypothetical protein